MNYSNVLSNLKNDYFLIKLFDILLKKKALYIVKYNKNIKKRIGININHYKLISEKYSSIKIEIKLVNNKFGKFININDEDKLYYHIYFDNNEEEIKRNYIKDNENVNLIKIRIDYRVKSFKQLFSKCQCIQSIDFKQFNTNNIKDMSYMFDECSLLKVLNLNNFKTNNVTDMGGMFSGCSSLKELKLNNFNTINVTNMTGMFSECSNDLIMRIKTQYKNIKEEAFEN